MKRPDFSKHEQIHDPDDTFWEQAPESWWVQALWIVPGVLLVAYIVYRIVL
jgi:hypothetical protein